MNNYLSYDQIRALAPAALNTVAAPGLSDKYAFISTRDVINLLGDYDWYPVGAHQYVTRRSNPQFGTHMITFRKLHPEQGLASYDVGDLIPQIMYIGDHAGRRASELFSGVEKLACKNGLTIPSGLVEDAFRQIHRGAAALNITGALSKAYTALDEAVKEIEEWKGLEVEPILALAFAQGALRVRYPDKADKALSARGLLTIRRDSDNKNDLWTTFNVIQENLVRGGAETTVFSRTRRLRAVRAVNPWKAINDGLWTLARRFANVIKAGRD